MKYRRLTGIQGVENDPTYTYASSLAHDHYIKQYVITVLRNHVIHLAEQQIISEEIKKQVIKALEDLEDEPLPQEGYEDVFEWIEDMLEKKTYGKSKWIWIGRSRNDHISAALRLYTRDKLRQAISLIQETIKILDDLQGKYKGVLIPLFTHRVPSQIGTVDCLLQAWKTIYETFQRILENSYTVVNRGPLGAGAGAGTLANLDPENLNKSLGFKETLTSSIYASGSRLDLAVAVDSASLVLVELTRIATDLITYQSPPYKIMILPDSHIATSSIMPHKRNPVTLEALLGKASRTIGCSMAFKTTMMKLPSGYSLDLQEANPCLYETMETLTASLEIIKDLLYTLRIDVEQAEKIALSSKAWSAELAEKIALEQGIPLRESYRRTLEVLDEVKDPRELLRMRKTGCVLDRKS